MTTKEQEAQNRKNDIFRDIFGVNTSTAVTIPTVLVFANETDSKDFQAWAKSVHYTALGDEKLPRNKARVYYAVNHLLNKAIDAKHNKNYAVPWSTIREMADKWRAEVAERESKLDSEIQAWEKIVKDYEKALGMAVKLATLCPDDAEMQTQKEETEQSVKDAKENLTLLYRAANTRAEKAKKELPYPSVGKDTEEEEEKTTGNTEEKTTENKPDDTDVLGV